MGSHPAHKGNLKQEIIKRFESWSLVLNPIYCQLVFVPTQLEQIETKVQNLIHSYISFSAFVGTHFQKRRIGTKSNRVPLKIPQEWSMEDPKVVIMDNQPKACLEIIYRVCGSEEPRVHMLYE